MRNYIILPAFALVSGIAGVIIRHFELQYAFELESGLAISGHPMSVALILLSMVVTAVFLLAVLKMRSLPVVGDHREVFHINDTAAVTAAVIACFLLLFYAGVEIVGFVREQPYMVSRLLLGGLTAWAAISMLLTSRSNFQGSRRAEYGLLLLVPVFFACFWLILSYRDHAADPVILDYVYELAAIICFVLSMYFIAGFAFGKPKVHRTAFVSLLGIYFSVVTLADVHSLGKTAAFAGIAIYLAVSTVSLLQNVKREDQVKKAG